MRRPVEPLMLVALVTLTGCGRRAAFDAPLDTRAPVALRSAALYVVPGQDAVALFAPRAGVLRWTELDARPRSAWPAPGGEAVVVLDDEAGATWLAVDRGRVVAARRYDLGADFDAVAFAPDGARFVAYHAPGGAPEAALRNPNQIALVDAAGAPGPENPVRRTLRAFGSEPTTLVISPLMDIAGARRQLVWALADRYLALFDLAAPAAEEVVVHLTLATDATHVVPRQVVNGVAGDGPAAFVRAGGSDDVFALTFPDVGEPGVVPRPYLNALPCGDRPADLAVVAVDGGPRVFAVNAGDASLAVIDPKTARRRTVPVGLPVSRLLPFHAPRDDGRDGRFALLWSPEGEAVVFADLDLAERRGGRALTPLVLDGHVLSVEPLPGRRAAVARLDSDRLVILDFDARTATPLAANGSLTDVVVDPSGDRVYAGVAAEGFSVVVVDVDTGTPASAEVPAGPGRLLLIPGDGRLLVDHGAETGHLSVLENLEDARFAEHRGLLLEGALDR